MPLKKTTELDIAKDLVKEDIFLKFDPECIRKKSNISKTLKEYRFDHPSFDPELLLKDIPTFSPKLDSLLKKIDELDAEDQKTYGKKFKHFIFSDLKMAPYGAKLIASALIAKGMTLGYTSTLNRSGNSWSSIKLLSDSELKSETSTDHFFLLSSVSVYEKPIPVKMRKEILSTFNKRPDNIYGELSRFIVLDSGFKEGIDLFDIKYVHMFEPALNPADQKQVIGRGTRTCGQKGLDFHPTQGWPLHVFIYDLEFPESKVDKFLNTHTAFELYMKAMNLDFRKLVFAQEVEELAIVGSVDYELNRAVHEFSTSKSDEMVMGGGPKLAIPKRSYSGSNSKPGYHEMREYIHDYFGEYTWPKVKMENQCIESTDLVKDKTSDSEKKGGAPKPMNYSPTQNFISNYFSPKAPVKGMLLWNSVGTGKTCTAIAAASKQFEPEGYTILWVTRTTLKNDIWKNMFDQICSDSIKNRIAEIPTDPAKQKRMLSDSWAIKPLSYKQFSNLVSQNNDYYRQLVKINGSEDPLRKTLLIIDEAHKLYGGGDLSSIERPDMAALHKAIMHSYAVSGPDSVRVLLMTATPITLDAMEMIKLLNLCRPIEQQLPASFETFQRDFLDDQGHFTGKGKNTFLDEIAGHISYLNREKDARQFSQPMIERVLVPIIKDESLIQKFDKVSKEDIVLSGLKQEIEEQTEELQGDIQEIDPQRFAYMSLNCEKATGLPEKKCNKITKQYIRELVKDLKSKKGELKQKIKDLKEKIKKTKISNSTSLKKVRENIKKYPKKYEEFKKTPYYSLKSECSTESKSNREVMHDLQSNPVILKYTTEAEEHEKEIQQMKESLKIHADAYKIKQKQLKQAYSDLKKNDGGEIGELETNVLQKAIKTNEIIHKGQEKDLKKEISERIVIHKSEIKKLNKTRKNTYNRVKKSLIKQIRMGEKTKKQTRKEEIKLNKIKREEGEYMEFASESLQKIVNDKEEDLKAAIEVAEEEYINHDKQNQEVKTRKLRDKEEKKEEKQKHREEAKTRKLRDKEERRDKLKEDKLKKREEKNTRKIRDKEQKQKDKEQKQKDKEQKQKDKEQKQKDKETRKKSKKNLS